MNNPPQPLNQADKLNLPEILRNYRKSLGLNQTDFAKRYGLETPTAVSFWESGFRDIPSRVIADIIAANYTPKLPVPAEGEPRETFEDKLMALGRKYKIVSILNAPNVTNGATLEKFKQEVLALFASQATAVQERAIDKIVDYIEMNEADTSAGQRILAEIRRLKC